MCRHAGLLWGGWHGGNSLAARECAAPVLSEREGLLCEFVSYFLLLCIVVVPVRFVCCSVKLPLSWPTSFCLFLFILLRTPAGGRGGHVVFFVAGGSRNQNRLLHELVLVYVVQRLAVAQGPIQNCSSSGSLLRKGLHSVCDWLGIGILQKSTTPKKSYVSFLLVGADIAALLLSTSIGIWRCPSCHFIPKSWISCACPSVSLHFMAKPAFRRIWVIFSPFSKTSSAVLPHTMKSSMHSRCTWASPFSSSFYTSPWQMVGLCFHP